MRSSQLQAASMSCRRLLTRHASCQKLLARTKTTLAVRRETINVWERRAPLAPQHVKQIIDSGVNVLVQPSTRRSYYMQEYEEVGAIITEDLSSATHIVGVKAPECEELIADKCYGFFSHVIKAQPEGMPLLDDLIAKRITLLDYERMTYDNGQRNVAFGKYAGIAGMINILHGLGLRLCSLGVTSPFLHIGLAHNYASVKDVVPVLKNIGESMRKHKLPKVIAPLTFTFTGSGNVSQGAQLIFDNLPHEYIDPLDMEEASKNGDPSVCYATVLSRANSMERIDGRPYSPEDYSENGDLYKCIFAEKVAPYTTCLVNGLYWDASSPRVLTEQDAENLFGMGSNAKTNIMRGIPQMPHKMICISDITCDIGGSIEFSKDPTTVGSPFQLYDPKTRTTHNDFSRDGVVVMSIDNLPCQLPREATEYFGDCLMPHIHEFLKLDNNKHIGEQKDVSGCISRAVITTKGGLAPSYKYIETLREKSVIEAKRQTSHGIGVEKEWRQDNKRVLLLGCGMVAEPVIEYLTRSADIKITVASNQEEAATQVAAKYRNTVPQFIDANDARAMKSEIKNHDLVISLLPHPMHPFIAELCVDARRNMLTASYATDKMKEIADRGKAKGIMIMNEIGLDPGIDHMMAMRLFDEIKANNGTIESFTSYCGGLPAPQYTNNPLRYKFTWFPRGVLLNAGTGEARYLQDGKTVSVAAGELMTTAKPFELMPGFNLESYPNRDSTVYLGAYGIENAHTVLRGTLRYKGYADAMQTLFETGLFSQNKMNLAGFTWKELVKELLGSRTMSDEAVKEKLSTLFKRDPIKMTTLRKLGLLDETPIPDNLSSPLDALVAKLESTLMMPDDESDVIIMNHNIGVRWPSGKCEIHRSNLVVYGTPGASAMSRTVGLPTGIAAEMMINGEISQRGLVLPFAKSIYEPILTKLEAEGICERREVEEVD